MKILNEKMKLKKAANLFQWILSKIPDRNSQQTSVTNSGEKKKIENQIRKTKTVRLPGSL